MAAPSGPGQSTSSSKKYRRIGLSPLAQVTETQRAGLERELGLACYVGMKHWRPWIADAVERLLGDGVTHLLGLVLAPHYSPMSIGGYRRRLERALDGRAALDFVESWHDHGPYLDVLGSRLHGTERARGLHRAQPARADPGRG